MTAVSSRSGRSGAARAFLSTAAVFLALGVPLYFLASFHVALRPNVRGSLFSDHDNFALAPSPADASGRTTGLFAPSKSLLSYQQSLGFFDDIPDDTWKLMQKKHNEFVQYIHPKFPTTGMTQAGPWYLNNLQPSFTCPHVQRVGGHGDGPKWTCDPHRLAGKKDCLIYSIGSRNEFGFEDGLREIVGNSTCEIHTFDPEDFSAKANERNLHYHAWGFKSSYDESYNQKVKAEFAIKMKKAAMLALGAKRIRAVTKKTVRQSNNPPPPPAEAAPELVFRTFPETVKMLGHENRTIDILKIDCEGCEFPTYKDWIGLDIRQVLIETHHTAPVTVDFFNAFFQNHFAMFSKELNYWSNVCYEFSFIKLAEEFWTPGTVAYGTLPSAVGEN